MNQLLLIVCKQCTAMKISRAWGLHGKGKKGYLPFSSLVSLWFRCPSLPGYCHTISIWERSQATPSAASGNCWQTDVTTLKLWPAAWEGNGMNLQSFVLFVNILQFILINLFSPLLLCCMGPPSASFIF